MAGFEPARAEPNRFQVYPVNRSGTLSLKKFITLIEKNLKIEAKKIYIKKQMGDVLKTKSNNILEKKLFKFKFKIKLDEGIKKFSNWFLNAIWIKFICNSFAEKSILFLLFYKTCTNFIWTKFYCFFYR